MISPEERDLARALIDELEPEDVQRAEPAPEWRTLSRNLSRSRLWPLRSDRPLGVCLTSDCGPPAQIFWQAAPDMRDVSLPVTLRRSSDSHGVHLAICGLPAGWQPIAIVIARFGGWSPFETAAAEDSVPQTTHLSARCQGGSRAADTALTATVSLSADDGTLHAYDQAEQSPLTFGSSDLTCHYHRSEALVEVAARLPLDQERHLGVVELSYQGGMGTVLQRLPLMFRICDRWKASAYLRPPESTEDGKIRLGVRPFSDDDLDLLRPVNVQELLASRVITSMPLEPVADGFVFRPTMEHHRHALNDANARWCVRVAPVGKEGEDDV